MRNIEVIFKQSARMLSCRVCILVLFFSSRIIHFIIFFFSVFFAIMMTQQLFSKQLNNNWDSHDFFDLLDLLDFAWHRAEKNIIISSSLRSVHKRIREIALDWSIILCHVLCLKPSSLLLGHKIGIGTDPPSFARFLPSGVAWLRICPNRQIRIVTGLATNIWRGSCCPCSYLYLTPSPCNQKIRQKSDKITNYRFFMTYLTKCWKMNFSTAKLVLGSLLISLPSSRTLMLRSGITVKMKIKKLNTN